eukprot:gene1396-12016_t
MKIQYLKKKLNLIQQQEEIDSKKILTLKEEEEKKKKKKILKRKLKELNEEYKGYFQNLNKIPLSVDKSKYVDIGEDVPEEYKKISGDSVIPILIFCHDRAEYLKRTLDTIFKYMPKSGFAVFISQDGSMESVTRVIKSFEDRVIHLKHDRKFIVPPEKRRFAVYHAISQHYKWGLTKVFNHPTQFSRVIILEEDIEVSPDFFNYFSALSPLLDKDESILCISSWNDNGQNDHAKDENVLYRTDFFPGLGWMMSKKLWLELQPKWPLGFWDDWLREPPQRKGRQCIQPEVPRTYTFGEVGSSGGQFYKQYLASIRLTKQKIDWDKKNLNFLLKENYETYFLDQVKSAIVLTNIGQLQSYREKDLKFIYNDYNQFMIYAKYFNVMFELKRGVPRCAYKGIVAFRFQGNRIFLVPSRPSLTYEN